MAVGEEGFIGWDEEEEMEGSGGEGEGEEGGVGDSRQLQENNCVKHWRKEERKDTHTLLSLVLYVYLSENQNKQHPAIVRCVSLCVCMSPAARIFTRKTRGIEEEEKQQQHIER